MILKPQILSSEGFSQLGIQPGSGGGSPAAGPLITGSGKAGELLTAPAGSVFQWRRGGVNIAGETLRYFMPSSSDNGASITVMVDGVESEPVVISGWIANLNAYESFPTSADAPLNGFVGYMSWSAHPGSATPTGIVSFSSEGVTPTANVQYYISDYIPSSASYRVGATFVYSGAAGAAGDIGILLSWDPSTLSGYMARYNGSVTQYQIWKFVAGSGTQLQFLSTTAPSSPAFLEFERNHVTGALTLYANGTQVLTANDTQFATPGRIGIRTANGATSIVQDICVTYATFSPVLALPYGGVNSRGWDSTFATWIQTQNTGDMIEFRFSGPELAIKTVNVAAVTGYYFVSIGGSPWRRFRQKSGTNWTQLFYNPGSTIEQNVRIMLGGNDSVADNWTTPVNRLRIANIHVAPNGYVSAAPARAKKWVVIGDSISRGRGHNEQYRYGDASNAWPRLVADHFGAELDFIAFSGQGYIQTGAGNVPKVSSAIGFYSNGRARAADPSVEVVIVAHGTNDIDVDLASNAIAAWTAIRALYPNAEIWVVLPNGYSANTASPSALSVRDSWNAIIAGAFVTWADSHSRIFDLTDGDYSLNMLGPLNASLPNVDSYDQIHSRPAADRRIADNMISKI